MENKVLVSLAVSPSVEDALTDWLLEQEEVTGFSSFRINGHGASIHSMSAAEQVAGRRAQVLFQIAIGQEQATRLVEGVKKDFSGSGVYYWLASLLEAGHLE
ncbi:MAG: DUF3240 family protein [Candidatus Polarisedimenticolaceae bacterium]|nr:DUF3240 family protein [Candidatus Polarisedimenticolaceae bacterium]